MPNYEFKCDKCDHIFCRFLSITDRNIPLHENCENCNCQSISKTFSTALLLSDSTMTANKKTGGQWNELMKKMKAGTPKRYHNNLDTASSRTARRWMG